MPKYLNLDVLDQGLALIKSGTQRIVVMRNYTAGMAYATVVSNIIASSAATSADFTLADQGTLGRKCTSTSRLSTTATATSVSGDDLHFALLDDSSSRVLAVTDESSNQVVTIGNIVTIPALTCNANQPT